MPPSVLRHVVLASKNAPLTEIRLRSGVARRYAEVALVLARVDSRPCARL
ncbi:hypothetical protein [Micromonospora pisi]|nr:hypothetical protein [Micromonospora pisi]